MSDGERPPVAVVTGAAGQDGFYLTRRLLDDGYVVHATVRRTHGVATRATPIDAAVIVHELDLEEPDGHARLIADIRPDEFYNLGGMSSVAASFVDPAAAWRTNANAVEAMLNAIRDHSPATRFYQASTSEMFGWEPGQDAVHDEGSALRPQSPYAAAKAAAHLLCVAHRAGYDLRIACGILFNHESSRRPSSFLTRKVVDLVQALRAATPDAVRRAAPLAMGNMAAERDWGFAPDYVDGMRRIISQVEVRAAVGGKPADQDRGANYRDYVLGTGQLHAVWQLVDRAFDLAGFPLDWDRAGEPRDWSARFRGTSQVAVTVDPAFIRPVDPPAIRADASRAMTELGWTPRPGLDPFLREMLGEDVREP